MTYQTNQGFFRRAGYALAAAGMLGAFTGCEKINPGNLSNEYVKQATVKPRTTFVSEKSTLEGKIMNVEPFAVSFILGDSNARTGTLSMSLVEIEANDGKNYTMICPYPHMIRRTGAKIDFRPLTEGYVWQSELISNFISTNHSPTFNHQIMADGIIRFDGIKYKDAKRIPAKVTLNGVEYFNLKAEEGSLEDAK